MAGKMSKVVAELFARDRARELEKQVRRAKAQAAWEASRGVPGPSPALCETRNSWRFYDRKRVKLNAKRITSRDKRELVLEDIAAREALEKVKAGRRVVRALGNLTRHGGRLATKISVVGLSNDAAADVLAGKISAFSEG